MVRGGGGAAFADERIPPAPRPRPEPPLPRSRALVMYFAWNCLGRQVFLRKYLRRYFFTFQQAFFSNTNFEL